jgi:hypothetical protein
VADAEAGEVADAEAVAGTSVSRLPLPVLEDPGGPLPGREDFPLTSAGWLALRPAEAELLAYGIGLDH